MPGVGQRVPGVGQRVPGVGPHGAADIGAGQPADIPDVLRTIHQQAAIWRGFGEPPQRLRGREEMSGGGEERDELVWV